MTRAQSVKVVRSPRFFEDTVRGLIVNSTSVSTELVIEILKKAGLLKEAAEADKVIVTSKRDFEICDKDYITITPLYGVVEETREIQYTVQDGPDVWTERGKCYTCREAPCIFEKYKAPDRVYPSYTHIIVVVEEGNGGSD